MSSSEKNMFMYTKARLFISTRNQIKKNNKKVK